MTRTRKGEVARMDEAAPATRLSSSELDPASWEEFREVAHRALDRALAHLASAVQGPVWQPVPAEVQARFAAPLPQQGAGLEEVVDEVARDVLAYPLGNAHPRFWGWVIGNGVPAGFIGEILAAAVNPNNFGAACAPAWVEAQVLAWTREMLGVPGGSGLLTSGGSMGNLTALAVAREAACGDAAGDAHRRLAVYASRETHFSIDRAARLLGIEALRKIPVDRQFRIELAALRAAIAADRAAGLVPMCVVANVGTVNTGAVDPLPELVALCRAERLWLHADGAFGAAARLASNAPPALAALGDCDSLVMDFHKWLYLQYAASVVLVRDAELHRRAFATAAAYLAGDSPALAGSPQRFSHYGIELSRDFKALKVWLALKSLGVGAFARAIERNLAQARHLAGRVQAQGALELLAPVELNIVCFRYRPAGLGEEELDALNAAIIAALVRRGIALPSESRVDGHTAIRVAICNHRTELADLDALVAAVLALGAELGAGPGPAAAAAT